MPADATASALIASDSAQQLRAPTVVIQPRKGLFNLELGAVWEYRELLYFLVWRNVKVRYKQTVVGAGWVILQPLLTMVIFTVVFSYMAKIASTSTIPFSIPLYQVSPT